MLTEMIPAELLEHQFKSRAERKWPSDPKIVKYSAKVAAELGGYSKRLLHGPIQKASGKSSDTAPLLM